MKAGEYISGLWVKEWVSWVHSCRWEGRARGFDRQCWDGWARGSSQWKARRKEGKKETDGSRGVRLEFIGGMRCRRESQNKIKSSTIPFKRSEIWHEECYIFWARYESDRVKFCHFQFAPWSPNRIAGTSSLRSKRGKELDRPSNVNGLK